MKSRVVWGTLFVAFFMASVAFAAPHLDSYYLPLGGWASGTAPFTLVFSEPMDPGAIVLPDKDGTNPNRSFEITGIGWDGKNYALFMAGRDITTRKGGRLLEFNGNLNNAYLDGPIGGAIHIRLFRQGFRSEKGELLDRDYDLPYSTCWECPPLNFPIVQAAFPTIHEAASDACQQLSIYFNGGVNIDTFRAELKATPGSPSIDPLYYGWDTPDPLSTNGSIVGYRHLTVSHLRLTPSSRPYQFDILHIDYPQWPRPTGSDSPQEVRFTVGPAAAGDLNADGRITLADVQLALFYAVSGGVTPTQAELFAGDVKQDGKITLADVIRILQYVIGLIPDYQWPE